MRRTTTILLWGTIFISPFFSRCLASDTVRITNGEWAPYVSENLEYQGVISRIVRDAFALEGVTVEYGFFPWGRAYLYAKEGRWDGSMPYTFTPKRAADFYYSDPIFPTKFYFFHLKDFVFDWQNLTDLKGILLGRSPGYDFGPDFDQAKKNKDVVFKEVPREELNFRMLLKGRIHIYPQDLMVGYQLVEQFLSAEEAALITHHPKPLLDKPQHLILSKKVKGNERMVEVFNRGLQRLKETEKYIQYFAEFMKAQSKSLPLITSPQPE